MPFIYTIDFSTIFITTYKERYFMFNMFGDVITGVNIEISDTADLSSISGMRLVDLSFSIFSMIPM